jgi:single-stranded-DNA-specific exonuclease
VSELPPSFLDVEQSLTGRRWIGRDIDARHAMALVQRGQLPEALGNILAARDLGLDELADFLEPTLKRSLPDPSQLLDMDRAASRLAAAVQGGEKIAVFGDYDVDGATSGALLQRFFRAVGTEIETYIPDRMREGYGPNTAALRTLRERGVKIVITVDCGIGAFEALAEAQAIGLDVIVVDHHAAEPRLPAAFAVINPNRIDQQAGLGHLAAVGVAFLLTIATNRALRQVGWYAARAEPDLKQWLDLVALGTVCDMVPLKGLNRALVVQGLKVMRGRANAGLVALAEVARVAEMPASFHLGFLFGPRVNAGGRVGQADLGTRLLATDDPQLAGALALRLQEFNDERRAIEAQVLAQAIEHVEKMPTQPALICVAAENWHAGVIGIVASRLVERYHRPCIVIALKEGIGKGSGRSVRGFDLGAAVIAARQSGLLINGGGHPMAAGLTVADTQLAQLETFLVQRAAAALGSQPPRASLVLDAALMPAAANAQLAEALARLEPFGIGNAEPKFALPGVRVDYAALAGGEHVRCVLSGGGAKLNAIAFRAAGNKLGAALLAGGGAPLHVAGTIRLNRWNGLETVQLRIEDAAMAGKAQEKLD